MYYSKRALIFTALFAVALGVGLHFLYFRFPNLLTALLAPVNESLWEHSKLVFWPYLLGAWQLNRGRPGGMLPWLAVLPALVAGMLAAGWLYNVVLGGEGSWVNIAIYVGVMVLGFWLPGRFVEPVPQGLGLPIMAGTAALGLALAVFTFYPPDWILFRDLSVARSWFASPCCPVYDLLQ